MSEPSRSELAEMFKASGFTSRDGTYLQGETFAVINAILALRAAKPERERDIARLIETIEGFYKFDCEAGPLKNCGEWIALKRALKGDPASTVAHLPNVVVTKQEW